MRPEILNKYNALKEYFEDLEEVVLAYSGGIESTLLLKVAYEVLGDEVVALIGRNDDMPEKDFDYALLTAREIGIEPIVFNLQDINFPDYCSNPVDRCYHCKKEIFKSFNKFMNANQLLHLIDGAHYKESLCDDAKMDLDFDIISPLNKLKIAASDIIELSKELGLTNWVNLKQSCLAANTTNSSKETDKYLDKLKQADKFLRDLKFDHVRVRLKNETLLIEVDARQVQFFFDQKLRKEVLIYMKGLGFDEVSINTSNQEKSVVN